MPTETPITNAVITSASILIDSHSCLTAWLFVEHGGGSQGFGGYALHLPNHFRHHAHESAYCGQFLIRCLEVAGVDGWDKLAGKAIRIKADHSKIHAIGHIIKDDWFCPSEEFKQMEAVPNKTEST